MVRKVKAAYSDVTPYGGYRDDEDQGQMGALGVLMAIGLFEVDGGCAEKLFMRSRLHFLIRLLFIWTTVIIPARHFKL